MNEALERQVIAALKERGLTLATAESCTGGLTAKRLTDVPGASAVFLGGVVSYTNGVKERALAVPHATLETYSAVSEPTARAMAEGVRHLTCADIGLSVTGVAGPNGSGKSNLSGVAGPDKDGAGHDVGTVYIALSTQNETAAQLLHLSGDRGAIRAAAADAMLRMLLDYLQ